MLYYNNYIKYLMMNISIHIHINITLRNLIGDKRIKNEYFM